MTKDRSSGTSTDSAMSPYSDRLSSSGAVISVSNTWPSPAAASPLMMKGLKLSKLPIEWRRAKPPFGAFGLA
jgi:hypothetical protein